MRPYRMTEYKGLQPDMACRLYAHRDTTHPKAWVLSWSVPGSMVSVGAEGERSRRYFHRRWQATEYGARHYGETPQQAYWR